jgi:hypothetical protein
MELRLRLRLRLLFERVLEVDFSESGVLLGSSMVAGVGWGFDHGLLDGAMSLRNGWIDPALWALGTLTVRDSVVCMRSFCCCSNDCGFNVGRNNTRVVAVL